MLVPVFENGCLLIDYTLDDIRKRAEIDAMMTDVTMKRQTHLNCNGMI